KRPYNVLAHSSNASYLCSRWRISMNRFRYILACLSMIAVPCASSQTWELGKDGAVKQTQTANNKANKGQSTGDQASPKGHNKTSTNDDDLKQQVNQKFGTDTALRYILVE